MNKQFKVVRVPTGKGVCAGVRGAILNEFLSRPEAEEYLLRCYNQDPDLAEDPYFNLEIAVW